MGRNWNWVFHGRFHHVCGMEKRCQYCDFSEKWTRTSSTFVQFQSSVTKVATPSSVTVPSSANLAFSFQIPISSGLVSVTGPSNFIFGTSDQSVSTPSDPSSNFPQHGLYSKFSLDLSKGGLDRRPVGLELI
ncbi:hypothetical protein BCR33DRAFT_370938 [Rhizoclosmatium globosum]|uniref:Uncharacterized protein n=1 Tax=Rhizoclosmatium globosum TaxID=329046 RepID=A0A1Y2BZU4_9FUNG|nr:hypothetical protein BCR33DRAFT_370938 [Rhizoclosmatium globosum]|eukprot:ORY40147.1 hypothetical protein BCR33DRAFT_370938 [Rhizoclosmatium globosum]